MSDPYDAHWSQQPTGYTTPGAGATGYPGTPAGPQPTQPVPPPYSNPYPPPLGREHPSGTIVLVLGILGFATGGISGLIAWVMSGRVLREIDADPAAYSNRQNVVLGRILGIVTTIIGAVGVLVVIAYIVFVFVLLHMITSAVGTY